MERLRKANFKLELKKCRFAELEVEYLGHVVSEAGIATDPRKVEAIRNFRVPQNLKSLRSFLGLAAYYRRFIPCFAKIASPMYALTRKDVLFEWSMACQEAFEALKQYLIESPVLAFPDFSTEFLLETDASGTRLGAVLAQKQQDGTTRPIAFASRSLEPHERNYAVTELEALAVVWSVKHF